MQNELHNSNQISNESCQDDSSSLPNFDQVTNESPQDDTSEISSLPKDKKGFFNLDTILTVERFLEIVLKFVIVGFVGFVLMKQLNFVNDLILNVAKKEYTLDSTTIQIVSTSLVVEFIFAMNIVIHSLFPATDRKNSLDYMQKKKSNGEDKPSENGQNNNTA